MKNNKSIYIVGIFMLITMVSIGYAILTGQLNINGSAKVKAASWDIYFTNIKIKNGSVNASVKPSITDKTTVNFEVELSKPGDFYEFNVDVVNDGMIDAMIESISITPELTTDQQKYLSYSVTYLDDVPLEVKDILHAKKVRTLKIRVEYLKSVENGELNQNNETINIKAKIKYVQADNTAKTPTSQEKTIDKEAPTIENVLSNVTTADNDTEVIVTFEVNDENEVIGTLTADDIKLKIKNEIVTPTTKTLSLSEINEKTYTLKISGIVGNGELTLEIDGTKISDEYGNQGEVITITPNVTIAATIKKILGTGSNVGDEIAIGNEHFYVIKNDGKDAVLLAKYNLLVENQCDSSNRCTPLENPTGIQDSTAIGFNSTVPRKGTLPFNSTKYWGSVSDGTYVYDNRASISQYVDNYKIYLEKLGFEIKEARLITYDELISLGCTPASYTCSAAPDWVKLTSYWTGSASNNDNWIWFVYNRGDMNRHGSDVDSLNGVRPVIVIPADLI